ncbi:MAG: hypothetical protein NXH75_15295 [Halobacteriovoraceae bacterium]|nr:hypothetical protein [Halobacteriovoraceae bacterium]
MARKLSKEEKAYFQNQLKVTLEELSPYNIEVLQKNSVIDPDGFKKLTFLFQDLSELASDLEIKRFAQYFAGFKDMTSLCLKVDNPRAHKKVSFMACDYANLIEIMLCSLDKPERLKGVTRAFEVISHKQERLKKGEFFTACRSAS